MWSVASLMVHVGGTQVLAEPDHVCFFLMKRGLTSSNWSKRSSILLGELMAIKIALESIKLEMERIDIKKIIIMLISDSQSAVGILSLGWKNKSHTSEIQVNLIMSNLLISNTWHMLK